VSARPKETSVFHILKPNAAERHCGLRPAISWRFGAGETPVLNPNKRLVIAKAAVFRCAIQSQGNMSRKLAKISLDCTAKIAFAMTFGGVWYRTDICSFVDIYLS